MTERKKSLDWQDYYPVTEGSEGEQLIAKMGIRLLSFDDGVLTGSMPVQGNLQPMGILHGGASAVLAETLGSIAARIAAGLTGTAVGTALHCIHHRTAAIGDVVGTCVPLYEGESTAAYQISIVEEATGLLTCSATLQAAIRRRRVPKTQAA